MHDVRVINPLRHFLQQPVVPDIVKIGSQVKIENARLPLDYSLSDSLDRVMGCPLGPISKRPRLEIRLEDRFEYELQRTLHHSVADSRNRENADFAPVLRYFLSPRWEWLVGALVSARAEHPRLALRWPRRSLHLRPERRRFVWPPHTLCAVSPSCTRERIVPRNARTVQPSP